MEYAYFPFTSGGGGGSVTDVTASSPLNSSGGATPNISFNSEASNLVLAGPATGGAAAPTFRSLVAADLPSLSGLYADVALDNLSVTAINADLLFGTDNTNSIGALATSRPANVYAATSFNGPLLTASSNISIVPLVQNAAGFTLTLAASDSNMHAGGVLSIRAGDAFSGGSPGGEFDLRAGDAHSNTGGALVMRAGNSDIGGAGGAVTINAGSTSSGGGSGGDIAITAGTGQAASGETMIYVNNPFSGTTAGFVLGANEANNHFLYAMQGDGGSELAINVVHDSGQDSGVISVSAGGNIQQWSYGNISPGYPAPTAISTMLAPLILSSNLTWSTDGTSGDIGSSDGGTTLIRPNNIYAFGNLRLGGNLGVGNSASASVAVGTLTGKYEIFNSSGASLGFVPIYASIT